MNRYEEELQKNIESGQTPSGDELDIKAYQQVFHSLKKEPGIKLPNDFSERVIARVQRKQKRAASRDLFWFGGGIFLLLIAFGVAIALTGFKFQLGFLEDNSAYTGIFVFGAAFIGLLSWLEKRLVSQQKTT
jgi:hypothetical protein